MLGLHQALATPRLLTPERAALLAAAALTAAATPPVVASIPDAAHEVGGSVAAMLVVMVTTGALAAVLGRRALRASSEVRARLWLVFGAAGAGTAATLLAFCGVALVRPAPSPIPEGLLAGSIVGGGPLGFVFGTALAPVILTAARARRSPSHDGLDRVLFAGGATLLAFGALRRLLPHSLPGAALGDAAALAGALTAAVAGARIVARIRLLARAREGGEPGFHVVPLSGREDEAPLLPLVRTAVQPSGVLAATGISAPYRGARGIFKLALAPLPEQRFAHPVADLIRAAAVEGGHAVLTLLVGVTAVMIVSPLLVLVVVATW